MMVTGTPSQKQQGRAIFGLLSPERGRQPARDSPAKKRCEPGLFSRVTELIVFPEQRRVLSPDPPAPGIPAGTGEHHAPGADQGHGLDREPGRTRWRPGSSRSSSGLLCGRGPRFLVWHRLGIRTRAWQINNPANAHKKNVPQKKSLPVRYRENSPAPGHGTSDQLK